MVILRDVHIWLWNSCGLLGKAMLMLSWISYHQKKTEFLRDPFMT